MYHKVIGLEPNNRINRKYLIIILDAISYYYFQFILIYVILVKYLISTLLVLQSSNDTILIRK